MGFKTALLPMCWAWIGLVCCDLQTCADDQADVAVLRAMVEQSERQMGNCRADIHYKTEYFQKPHRMLREFKGTLEWDSQTDYEWAHGTNVQMWEMDFAENREPRGEQWTVVRSAQRGLIRLATPDAKKARPVTLTFFEDTNCRNWLPVVRHLNHRHLWFSTSESALLPWSRILADESVTPNGSGFERSITMNADGPSVHFVFSTGQTLDASWSSAQGGNIITDRKDFPATGNNGPYSLNTKFKWQKSSDGFWFPASLLTEKTNDSGEVTHRTRILLSNAVRIKKKQVNGGIFVSSLGAPEPGTRVRTVGANCKPTTITWREDGKESLEQKLLQQARAARQKGLGATKGDKGP